MSRDYESRPSAGRRVQRPDKEAYQRKSVDEYERKIEVLKKKLKAIESKNQGGGVKEEISNKKNQLHHELGEIISERSKLNEKREAIIEKIKKIREMIKSKTNESREAKDKVGFKTVADIEAQIRKLDQRISQGGLSLLEEKKVVAEISSLNKAKRDLQSLSEEQTTIEADKATLEQLQAQLNALDPERDDIKKRMTAVKAQLDAVKDEQNKSMESLNQFYGEKNAVKDEINALYNGLKQLRKDYKEANDQFYTAIKEERARKEQEYQKRKIQERLERLTQKAEEELENANVPAFTEEINWCNTLLKHFETTYGVSSGESATGEAKNGSSFEKRQVEGIPSNMVALTKKDNREDDYLVLGKKKQNKKAAPSKAKPIRVDLEIIDQLSKLKIEVPASLEGVQKTVQSLVEKKKYFLDNQEAQTAENKRRAEENIRKAQESLNAAGDEVGDEDLAEAVDA